MNRKKDKKKSKRENEEDEGREYEKLNLVKVVREAPDPVTGITTPGSALLQRYTSVFMRALFAKGGHPAISARKIGGYVDAWNTNPDPGWHIVGFMRYRSRRDMMKLVVDPRFLPAHDFKFAAMAETFSFPTRPIIRIYATTAAWVPLVFALPLLHISQHTLPLSISYAAFCL